MSVGNLKDNGNKGNNFPWQYAMLELLGQIAAGGGGGGGGCCPPVVRTPAMLRASAVGSVTAGKRSASFFNAGAINATVLGAALKPGEMVNFSAESTSDSLSAIAYDATGSDLLIATIV
jgi:hypothetical protein